MQRFITPFLVGSVAGAALISAVFAAGAGSQPSEQENAISQTIPMADTTTPSQEPKVSPAPISSPKPLTERTDKLFDSFLAPLHELENKLYEGGVTTQGTVETVFAGTGFILRDELSDEIFVQWTADPPEDGQDIIIKGILQNVAESQAADPAQQQNYPPRLKAFLRDHRTLIEAEKLHQPN